MYRIYYGDKDVFAGISPVPYIERDRQSIDVTNKWGYSENFVLRGEIIGNCPGRAGLDDMWAKKDRLFSEFQDQFKNFYIKRSGEAAIYSGEVAIIKNISFDESYYANKLPYTVNLDVWKGGNFTGFYGVSDPSDNITFTEGNDGIVNVTRTITAQGLKTAERSAFENAKSYVEGISGKENVTVTPLFASSPDTGSMFLESQNTSIDRLAGSYELEQNFLYDEYNTGMYTGTILRTTTEMNSGTTEVTVSVKGKVQGGIDTTLEQLRQAYSGVDLGSLASGMFGSIYGRYRTLNINENQVEKTLDFNAEYSNKEIDDISLIDSFTVTRNFDNNLYCANGNVTIKANYGTNAERWDAVRTYYSSFDIKDFILDKWDEYGYSSSGQLEGGLNSFSYSEDSGNALIRVGGGICQKGTVPPSGFDEFDFSVSCTPAQTTFIEHAGLRQLGDRIVQRLGGKTRSVYTLQGTAIKSGCIPWGTAASTLESKINELKTLYVVGGGDPILTAYSINTGISETKNVANFSATWSVSRGEIFEIDPIAGIQFNGSWLIFNDMDRRITYNG